MTTFAKLHTLLKSVALLCVLYILVQPYVFADSAPVNVKALIYSETAAELQWNRPDGQKVQVSYNGVVIGALDANSYFTDRLNPELTHRFQLRTAGADGLLSRPVEITFTTEGFTPPVRQIRVEDSLVASDTSLPSLAEVRLLAYSNTAVELFWTRFGTDSSIVEVIHNGVSMGIMDKSSAFFTGLDSNRAHQFLVRPVREAAAEQEWFSVSVDLSRFSGNVQGITATRVVEQSSATVSAPMLSTGPVPTSNPWVNPRCQSLQPNY